MRYIKIEYQEACRKTYMREFMDVEICNQCYIPFIIGKSRTAYPKIYKKE
jgi:hypothetical protein